MRLKLILAIGAALIIGFCSLGSSVVEEELSERWATQYHGGGPDSYGGTYLVRRTGRERKEVSNKIFDALSVDDDCVIYFDHNHKLFGACGDRPSVLIAEAGDNDVVPLNRTVVRVGTRDFQVKDIKRAAREVEQEALGGSWYVQRKALPLSGEEALLQVYRDYSGTILPFFSEVLAYRYLEDDCLLYVYPGGIDRDANGVRTGVSYGVFATCGRRYEALLGSVEDPSDVNEGDEIRIEGEMVPVSTLKQRALAEPER